MTGPRMARAKAAPAILAHVAPPLGGAPRPPSPASEMEAPDANAPGRPKAMIVLVVSAGPRVASAGRKRGRA